MKFARWTEKEIRKLKSLASDESRFFSEIAKDLGRSPASTRWMARKLGISIRRRGAAMARMGEWNRKHAHLHEQVLKFYLSHSFEETADHFGLTRSEMKSCLTYAYKEPSLKHIRKEWRPHSAWSDEDWLFMVRHAGVRPREWIAKKLKRGSTYNSVKDALAKFQGSGKYFNGMPWGWAQHIFGEDAIAHTIKTKAGPTGNGKNGWQYRLIPWVECERLLNLGKTRRVVGRGRWGPNRARFERRIQIAPEVERSIRAMAKFQRWIHGTKGPRATANRIRESLKGR